MIERVLYWAIIIILLALLIFSYLKDTSCSSTEQTANGEETGALAVVPDETIPEEEPAEEPVESCTDDIKNQDETDVDCGGTCNGCAIGETCEVAGDCLADYCTANKCTNTAPVVLNGDLDIEITNVEVEVNEGTGASKLTRIDFTIDNGLDENLGPVTVKAFVMSTKTTNYCLNNFVSPGTCDTPYASFLVTGPRSGKMDTYTEDTGGTYLSATTPTMYDHGDKVNVWLYLYDQNGNEIDGTISTFRAVDP